MIYWEHQSWETGGDVSRLTIWADGGSEVMVVPDAYFRSKPEKLQIHTGWEKKQGRGGLYFVRRNVFPPNVAKDKFNKALASGICLLKPFKPGYVDGSGTVIGIQINGDLKKTVIPMFLDKQKGTANHRRFIMISKILSNFDRHAYEIKD